VKLDFSETEMHASMYRGTGLLCGESCMILAGSLRLCCSIMQQRAPGRFRVCTHQMIALFFTNDVMAAILKVWRRIENSTPSIWCIYLMKLQWCQISSRSHWNNGALGFTAMLRRARLWDCMSSVCLSVTFRYRDQIGWNSSKIISRLKDYARADPNTV